MKCVNCGAELSEGSKFCDKCGAPLGAVQDGTAGVMQVKKSSPLKNIAIGIVVIFVLLLIIGSMSDDEDDTDSVKASKTSTSQQSKKEAKQDEDILTPEDFTEYNMNTVFEDFENNPLGADKKYSGALMKGTVKVDSVTESLHFANLDYDDYSAVYFLATDSENVGYSALSQGIGAIANEDVLNAAYELNPGEIITVYLEYIGTDFIDKPEFILYGIE